MRRFVICPLSRTARFLALLGGLWGGLEFTRAADSALPVRL